MNSIKISTVIGASVFIAMSAFYIGLNSQDSKPFPAPIKRIFEAQDGLHVLYKADKRVEDILIELEDEQDVYSFDINGKVHSVQIIRHCTIGDCDVVDVVIDNDNLVCVPSHVRRANQ